MKIVCIGGGHGLSQVLTALRPLNNDISAIIATTDNGGSTGKLRQAKNCIAYGDIRRCILALANSNNLLTLIAQQRFENAGELSSHSLGNLILLALSQVTQKPSEAIYWLCQLLDVQQTILPMSDQVTDLSATLIDGSKIVGECEIDALTELPQALGLTMSDLAGISSNMLNFHSSIEAELTAELFIGKQLNLEQARLFALTGDYNGLRKEIMKNIGSEYEFLSMNVLAKQKYAAALGMSVDQMSNLVMKNQLQALLQFQLQLLHS